MSNLRAHSRARHRRLAEAAFLVAAVQLGCLGRLRAEEPGGGGGPAVIVRTPENHGGWPEAEYRTMAELTSVGLDVESYDAPADLAREPDDTLLPRLLVEQEAAAAIRIRVKTRTPGGAPEIVAVTVAATEKTTGRPRLYRGDRGGEGLPLSAARAAVVAAEFLYALRQEIRWPEKRTSTTTTRVPRAAALPGPAPVALVAPAAPAPVADLFPARRHSWRVAGLAAATAGEVDSRPGLAVGSTWFMVEHPDWQLGLDGEVAGILQPASFSVPGGGARAKVLFLSPRVQLLILARPTGRVSPFAALGGGVLVAHTTGESVAPYPPARADNAGAALATVEIGVTVRLIPTLSMRFAVTSGLSLPEIGVRLGGQDVGAFGRPLLFGTMGLAWDR